eukprot:scaffold4644_cov276-Prasinococcus_capsulatus_cf.AAC.2
MYTSPSAIATEGPFAVPSDPSILYTISRPRASWAAGARSLSLTRKHGVPRFEADNDRTALSSMPSRSPPRRIRAKIFSASALTGGGSPVCVAGHADVAWQPLQSGSEEHHSSGSIRIAWAPGRLSKSAVGIRLTDGYYPSCPCSS